MERWPSSTWWASHIPVTIASCFLDPALSYFQQTICSVLFSCSSVSSFIGHLVLFLFQIFCCFSVKGQIISESSLLLSCLCCTLSCYINIVRSGVLSFLFLFQGQRFVGDLLPDGKIKSQETDIIFASPSAWAIHCKRIINPEKKSGCGWASVCPILILSWRCKQMHILRHIKDTSLQLQLFV